MASTCATSSAQLRPPRGLHPQQGLPFSGTVESNLKFAGESVTDEDDMPRGPYRAGQRLHRGTRRRLCLRNQPGRFQRLRRPAPASLHRTRFGKEPRGRGFDDSFSALDYKTDALLREALARTQKDAALVVVAQRIATIMHADQIVVLDEGAVVGSSTHDELLRSCPAYLEIAQSQLSARELDSVKMKSPPSWMTALRKEVSANGRRDEQNRGAQAPDTAGGPMGGGRRGPGAWSKSPRISRAPCSSFEICGSPQDRGFLRRRFRHGSVIFNIVGPKVLGQVTTKLFEGLVAKVQGTGAVDFDWIGKTLLLLLGLYLTSSTCNLVQGWLMTGVTQKICYRMRKEIAQKITVIPMSYFNGHSKGDVLSRITNDVDTLGQSLNQSVTQLITSITQIIGVLVMMLSISLPLTGVVVVTLPVAAVIMGVMMHFSQPYFREQQQVLGAVNGIIEEDFAGQNVIQVFDRADASVAEFDEKNDRLFISGWRSQFLSGLMMPLMSPGGQRRLRGRSCGGRPARSPAMPPPVTSRASSSTCATSPSPCSSLPT